MGHCSDVIMSAMASQITDVMIVYWTVCSGVDQRKHQSSTWLAFVRGTHRWPVNSPHKDTVTQKMFPFDDVIHGESVSFSRAGTMCIIIGMYCIFSAMMTSRETLVLSVTGCLLGECTGGRWFPRKGSVMRIFPTEKHGIQIIPSMLGSNGYGSNTKTWYISIY